MHITENRSGSAKMKQVSKILVPANSSVELKPGGAHLMLIGPRRDVQAGEKILMIAQDSLERRFMLKFTVIDMRQETSHNDHNHDHHNHSH
jgi:copper(I)-binding protein